MHRVFISFKVLVNLVVIGALLGFAFATPAVQAADLLLPAPGTIVHLSPAFNPPVLKGIKVYPENPLRFDFVLDRGSATSPEAQSILAAESAKLVKYFLASLTIPEKDLWVNLSPYEKDRIVPEAFGQTEMGRDLLAQDYLLKQITASLMYPEDEAGRKFWNTVYAEAARKFGTTSVSVNTFNKVWIVPEKAVVYENGQAGAVYVVESRLKVMLEQDYLALKNNTAHKSEASRAASLGSQIVREVVIPQLTKEVNEGKNFAPLRQVYNSLILAAWYRKKLKENVLGQVYSNQNKVAGINIDDPQEKRKIYGRYLAAFKKGAYNLIKEEIDPLTQKSVPRKYFSGGFAIMRVPLDYAMASQVPDVAGDRIRVELSPVARGAARMDSAMRGEDQGEDDGGAIDVTRARAILHDLRNLATPLNGYIDIVWKKMREGLKGENRRQFNRSVRAWDKFQRTYFTALIPEEVSLDTIGQMQAELVAIRESLYTFGGNNPKVDEVPEWKDLLRMIGRIWSGLEGIRTNSPEGDVLHKESTLIQELIVRTVYFYQLNPDVALEYDFTAKNDPYLEIDKNKIGDAIFNIVKNAYEAQTDAPKKRIKIQTGLDEERNSFTIVISDGGKGIPEQYREKIFEGDFTTKGDQGNGLGLSNVRQIVRAHGGDVYVAKPRTRKGALKGAAFVITLPLRAQPGQVSGPAGGAASGDQAMNSSVARDGRQDVVSVGAREEVMGAGRQSDKASTSDVGGIDLTAGNMLSGLTAGQAIKFHIDPAQVRALERAAGFTPVILSIQPETDVRLFLGIPHV